jgi:hypothetical protein
MTAIQGYKLYGGATITRAVDGAGAEYIACCANRLADNKFGFYIFKGGQPLQLTPFCSGRGSINNAGVWVAWEDEQFFEGQIPSFAPYVASAIDPRVDALISQIGALSQQITAIETALGNLGAEGGMSEVDAELIRRIRAFLLPLLGP